MALWLGTLFVYPDVLQHTSTGRRLANVGLTVVIVAICDWWFSRRMGFSVTEEGVVLHHAFHRSRVPWSTIEGFTWRRWRSRTTETLWIATTRGAPVRVPTVARTSFSWIFSSASVRSRTGEVVDATFTLNEAWGAARAENGAGRRPFVVGAVGGA